MTSLLALITAMAISMAIIPIMARLAPRLGMIDRPDPRKVHVVPVPRAGGVGIVLGSLVPIAAWLPLDHVVASYLFGAMVLLLFGVWDDIKELGHFVKFGGQFIAVIPVVYYGDLFVTHLPFMGLDTIPESIGRPFTVFALVGMINAINHSDGLDGLAGGMSLLSLSCMAYLALMADGYLVLLIALGTIGGVFGFLRYNTYPARVFMGDGGSQFLGFTLGFLTVYLVERANTALSPALPALVLGLPIVDILAVFAQRVYHGMNWFRASKNHIHHRLLQLGFDHYEAVVIIYSIQFLLVTSAVLFSYESDLLITSFYAAVCTGVFAFLIVAERTGWRAHSSSHVSGLTRIIQTVKRHHLFTAVPVNIVLIAVPALFIFVSASAAEVPHDLGVASAILAVILFAYLIFRKRSDSMIGQAVIYVTAAFVVYLESRYFGQHTPLMDVGEIVYFVLVAVATGIIIRYDTKAEFRTTPLDYLVIFVVLFAGFLLYNLPEKADLGLMAIKLVVLFYGCELIYARTQRKKWYVLSVSTLGSLLLLAARGVI
ncbi:MAG TPA: MraY family glycosyltransferase [Burkholderiales bacterium]|nr:MraY family glycosyltransferase [Burkholderiales bacterium]